MRTWQSKVSQTVTADVTITGVTETVVATTPPISVQSPDALVRIDAWAQITGGADQTGLKFRIRRGTDATGTLIGEANTEGVAATVNQTDDHSLMVTDSPGDSAGLTYVLTVQQSGGVANGAAISAYIEANF